MMQNVFQISQKLLAIALCLAVTSIATAKSDETQTGRYLTVANKPTSAQLDLLSQTIQMRFPDAVKTIGDAMQYVLRYSGYSLVDEKSQSDALQSTLKKPLPLVDRTLQPMSLKDALMILVGPAFTLKADILNRQINFQVKPAFAHQASIQEN